MRTAALTLSTVLALASVLAGCDVELGSTRRDAAPLDDGGRLEDAGRFEDAGPSPDAGLDGGPGEVGIAPAGTLAGERTGEEGPNGLTIDGTELLRIDAGPDEHITFFLTFERRAEVELEVLRWDGAAAVSLGLTDAGPLLRTLAVFDPRGPRTFWARITTTETTALPATLTITRTPFTDGGTCADDCARLLQLPLPNDPAIDGYAVGSGTVFRYQYGRRDLVMFLRHAGQQMAAAGHPPFEPQDLSQWDGATPGTDTGSLRHASHQRGKDVDIPLYGLDGLSAWRSYCSAVNDGSGRECIPGSITNYDGAANALLYSHFLGSGRVTMSFLDDELIPSTIDGAASESAAGAIPAGLVPLYSDGRHLQHWPNHDNHIHVRVSEELYGASALTFVIEPGAIEPP